MSAASQASQRVQRSASQPAAVRLVLALAATGVPVGLLWLVLAPRREYEVVEGGFQAIEPQSEAMIGADAWLTILTAIMGVAVAVLVWRFVGARGVSVVVGLAAGMVLASVVAWQIGELLGGSPSETQTAQIGAIVAPPLQLRAVPVLIIGAFLATLSYLVLVSFAPRDDLRRSHLDPFSSGSWEPPTAAPGPGPLAAPPGPSAPYATDAIGPRAEQPSGLRPAVPGDPRQ